MPDPESPSAACPVNVAVVGLGFMGVTHLRAYLANPLARVVAICGNRRMPENGILKGVAGNIQHSADIHLGPETKCYHSLEDLLADPEVRLVDICTPTPLHSEQVIAALKAGKHVICEKPLARTAAAAREIVAAAADSPGFLMPAMCMRFWPGWSWLKQAVADRTYGNVLAAGFRRVSAMPGWNRQNADSGAPDLGGALFDLHIHDTDFIAHLFGRPAKVFSNGVADAGGSIHHVVTQYLYPGGPVVHAEGSWLLKEGFNMQYTLHFEHATADFDLSRGTGKLIITETGQSPRVVDTRDDDGYTVEIDHILQCVAHHRPPEVVTAEHGVTALEICEAEEASILTGVPVKP